MHERLAAKPVWPRRRLVRPIWPIIAEGQTAGMTSLGGLARRLIERGMRVRLRRWFWVDSTRSKVALGLGMLEQPQANKSNTGLNASSFTLRSPISMFCAVVAPSAFSKVTV